MSSSDSTTILMEAIISEVRQSRVENREGLKEVGEKIDKLDNRVEILEEDYLCRKAIRKFLCWVGGILTTCGGAVAWAINHFA